MDNRREIMTPYGGPARLPCAPVRFGVCRTRCWTSAFEGPRVPLVLQRHQSPAGLNITHGILSISSPGKCDNTYPTGNALDLTPKATSHRTTCLLLRCLIQPLILRLAACLVLVRVPIKHSGQQPVYRSIFIDTEYNLYPIAT